jgi:hypothetical protein
MPIKDKDGNYTPLRDAAFKHTLKNTPKENHFGRPLDSMEHKERALQQLAAAGKRSGGDEYSKMAAKYYEIKDHLEDKHDRLIHEHEHPYWNKK